jgi:hypothetical protein
MRTSTVLLALIMLLPAGPAAAQVYKCTGKDGRVSYSQTPPKEGACKENLLRSTEPTGADSGSLKQFNENIDASRKTEAQDKQKADREAALAANKQVRCSNARSRLAFLEQASRLAVIDESGQRHYKDEAQKQQMKAEAQAAVAANCS